MTFEKAYNKFGVDLKPSGDKWVGCCPFHGEATPSFFVYPDGGYHCFGCQEHGTYRDFVERFGGKEFSFVINTEDIKEKTLLHLEKHKDQLDSELYLMLEDVPRKIKDKAWKHLDELWLDLNFMLRDTDTELVHVLLTIRRRFSEIKKMLKNT